MKKRVEIGLGCPSKSGIFFAILQYGFLPHHLAKKKEIENILDYISSTYYKLYIYFLRDQDTCKTKEVPPKFSASTAVKKSSLPIISCMKLDAPWWAVAPKCKNNLSPKKSLNINLSNIEKNRNLEIPSAASNDNLKLRERKFSTVELSKKKRNAFPALIVDTCRPSLN